MSDTDPQCRACGLSCGVRACKPRQFDICCEDCPEERLYQKRRAADAVRHAHNMAIWYPAAQVPTPEKT